jgi:hypothetical protein
MFSGSADAGLPGSLDQAAVYAAVEDALDRLGRTRVNSRGDIDIEARSGLGNMLTATTLSGSVRKRGNEWVVDLDYTCSLSGAGWVIGVLGILFFFGFLVFLGPMAAKSHVEKSVRRSFAFTRSSASMRRPNVKRPGRVNPPGRDATAPVRAARRSHPMTG